MISRRYEFNIVFARLINKLRMYSKNYVGDEVQEDRQRDRPVNKNQN